jgi:hypothetical protein
MLRGDVIELRPVRDADLATLYELMTNLDTRGPYFPLGVMSEPAFRAAFAKNGFWEADEGMLVMVKDGEIVGEIEYFRSPTIFRGMRSPTSCSGTSTRAAGTPRTRSGCWLGTSSVASVSTGCS